MKLSLRTRLEQLSTRLAELDHLLAAPETASDRDKFRAYAKEHAEVTPVVALFEAWRRADADAAAADEMASDPAMKQYARDERVAAEARMAALEQDLQAALLPKDGSDLVLFAVPVYGVMALHTVYDGGWVTTIARALLVSLLYWGALLAATAALLLALLWTA